MPIINIPLDLIASPAPIVEHGADWYNQRRQGIGGSDAAAVLGYSRWHSAYDVWRSKIDDTVTDADNESTRRGSRREPELIQEYSNVTGKQVYSTPHLIHPDYPYVCANLDGIIPNERVIEAKTARRSDGWGEPETEDIPIDYYLQTQHYMLIAAALGLIPEQDPLCDIFVSIAGEAIRIYTIKGNKELWAAMLGYYARFWRHVTDLTPPDNLTVFEQVDLLPASTTQTKYASDSIIDIAEQAVLVNRQIDKLTEHSKELKAQLLLYAGDCEAVLNADGSTLYTCKTSKPRVTVDTARLKKEQPEIYAQYLTEGKAARPIRIIDKEE